MSSYHTAYWHWREMYDERDHREVVVDEEEKEKNTTHANCLNSISASASKYDK